MRLSRRVLLAPAALAVVACTGGNDGGSSEPSESAESAESWCDVVAASNALDDVFDATDTSDAAALKSVLDQVDRLGDRFRAAAPREIRGEVEAYATANGDLVDAFAAADYVVEVVDSARLQEIIDGIAGITTEVDVFTIAACGVPLGPDDT